MAGTSLFFDIFGRDQGVGKVFDDVADKADRVDGKLRGTADNFSNVMRGAAFAKAGQILGDLVVQMGTTASEAEQNIGAVETVFGSAAGKVQEFASKSAEAVGLSSSKYNELAATTGTALKAAGVPFDQLAEKNDVLIQRGADLASVFGGTTADAVQAMGSAFRGEFDPLERYGVTLNMNQVNAQLAADGLDNLTGASLETAKKQEILKLIMDQSKDSAGNFAKEADTAAGAQQRANAAWEDAQSNLGEALLPLMKGLADFVKDASHWISEHKEIVTQLGVALGILAGVIVVVNVAMGVAALVASPVAAAIVGITVAVGVLIAGIVLLIMHWGEVVAFIGQKWNELVAWWNAGMTHIGEQWNAFWSGMGNWARDTWGGFVGWLKSVWDGFVGWWADGMRRIGDQWNGFWGGLDRTLRGIWDGVLTWFRTNILDGFSRALDSVKGFFSDTVTNIGRIWDGIKDKAKAPVNWVIDVVVNNGIVKGFNDFSRGLFGNGGPRLGTIPMLWSGGYTGDGGKYEPKGVVHGGEFVFTKEETSRAGVGTLQRLARTLRGFAEGGFVNPVAGGGTITQGFSGLSGHNGIDIAAPTGTPVLAAFDGNVAWTGWSQYGGGNEIHIKHAGGWETWYAHLSNIIAKAGQVVNRAAQIGMVGMTGNATGPHLHYMLMKGGWPNVVDPSPYMDGKVPAGAFLNPIPAIMDAVMSGFRGLFGNNMMADIAAGVATKLAGGVGDWIRDSLFRGNTGGGVFDNGGWLTGVGVNTSGRPEAVLTGAQSDAFVRLATRGLNLDGYTLELNADATKATFRRIAAEAADDALNSANDDLYRGAAR